MKTLKKHSWIIAILVINLVLVLYPTINFSLPITQTDGLTYFGISETLAETGDFHAEIPDSLPVKGEEGTYVKEFLPVPTLYLAAFIKVFGAKAAMNGGALGLLFVLGNLFLFLLVSKLTNKKIALITTLFSIFNLRFYYLFWGGNWANVFAITLSLPTLYFFYKYLHDNKTSSFSWMVLFLMLTAGSHTVHYLFTVCLMIGMWFGVKVMKNVEIKLPKIEFNFAKPAKDTWKMARRSIAIIVVAFFATFVPFALAGTRTKWIAEWIDHLKAFDKVPEFWHYGFITDGPILVVLAAIALIYALYKQNWELLGLAVPSYIIVCLTKFLVPEDIWLSLFVYRFQAFHFIILALLTAYFVFSVIKEHPKLQKLLLTLLLISFLWQTSKVVALTGNIQSAITDAEYVAALEVKGEDFWLLKTEETDSSFRSHEWIMYYGDGHADNFSTELTEEALAHDYLIVQDIAALTEEDLNMLLNKTQVFTQDSVAIYQ